MSIPKIALDAGHGLYTSGKQTPDGIKEWTLNDAVCDKIERILKDYVCTIIRLDNNEGEVDEPLAERFARYQNEKVTIVVSVHHNAFTGDWNGATGVEVWADLNATAADLEFANLVYGKLVEYTGLRGRGVKKENFYIINTNRMPAVLIEGGFMDSTNDYKVITSEEGQEANARAVAESLIEFLNLEKKETEEVKNKIEVTGFWDIPTTMRAQEMFGIEVTGTVSNQLAEYKGILPNALEESWHFSKGVKRGSEMVKEIQILVGVYPDGVMGKKTVLALQKFLNAKGYIFYCDGIMGVKTVSAWQMYLNSCL